MEKGKGEKGKKKGRGKRKTVKMGMREKGEKERWGKRRKWEGKGKMEKSEIKVKRAEWERGMEGREGIKGEE